MRQISNEFMVLSQQDARDILAAVASSPRLGDAHFRTLACFASGHGPRYFYSASDLLTASHAEPRLQYMVALNEEIATIRTSDQEAHLLGQTKGLMSPCWTFSGRVAAIKRVREITGMTLPEAAKWVDLHYEKS